MLGHTRAEANHVAAVLHMARTHIDGSAHISLMAGESGVVESGVVEGGEGACLPHNRKGILPLFYCMA